MSTMHAWWVVPGPDGGESEWREIEVPTPGEGHVLVRVRSAGVNRGELIGRPGLRSSNPKARPIPSGIELAGEIVALGAGVDSWSVDDRVMARGSGCHAEFAVIDQRALMAVPETMSFADAACIPNVFVTAHDALVSAAATQPGESVLITAGSSGVGTAAIQLARELGAGSIIATTRSPSKGDALMALGATAVLDTTKEDWSEQARGADVVIDQVGGRLFPGLLRTMALEARYVSVGRNDGPNSEIDLDLLAKNRLRLIGVTFRTRTPDEALACGERFMADFGVHVAEGRVRPVLDRTFPLDQLPAAHAHMLTDTQVGKVVLLAD